MKALAWLLVLSALLEVFPFHTSEAQAVAIDTVAARQLATEWIAQAKNSKRHLIGCGYAHYEGQNLVLDSVPRFIPSAPDAEICQGTRANAVFGFIVADEAMKETVLAILTRVLAKRPDLALIGEVHGVVPTATREGTWILAPLIWVAWRGAPETEQRT